MNCRKSRYAALCQIIPSGRIPPDLAVYRRVNVSVSVVCAGEVDGFKRGLTIQSLACRISDISSMPPCLQFRLRRRRVILYAKCEAADPGPPAPATSEAQWMRRMIEKDALNAGDLASALH
jgi:hypothetical protein